MARFGQAVKSFLWLSEALTISELATQFILKNHFPFSIAWLVSNGCKPPLTSACNNLLAFLGLTQAHQTFLHRTGHQFAILPHPAKIQPARTGSNGGIHVMQ